MTGRSALAAVCQFTSLEGAVAAVLAALQSNLKIARIELLDEVQMRPAIRYSKLDYVETPTLFLEFHGTPAGVQEEVEMMQAITADHGGGEFHFVERPEDRNRLWKARHNSYQAVMALSPGKNNMGTDACVPISALPACLLEIKADIAASGLTLAFRTARRTIAMGGTCSGEHGHFRHSRETGRTFTCR